MLEKLGHKNFKISNRSAGATLYLDGVLSSTCCDLDATISDSYGGSGQTWANLISSPADGSGQTDYDFILGHDTASATDDPTLNGTAGTTGADFSVDGGRQLYVGSRRRRNEPCPV